MRNQGINSKEQFSIKRVIVMAIALSQDDYWGMFYENVEPPTALDEFAIICQCPVQLGQGVLRQINLRDGLVLDIANYQHHDDIILCSYDQPHPLEYTFHLSGDDSGLFRAIPYHLYGSGTSPAEQGREIANHPIQWLSVHIEPVVFQTFVGDRSGQVPDALQHLIGDPEQEFYVRSGQATPAMQIVLQQILHCPYQGFLQRMFLESKVWELMTLVLEQETEAQQGKQTRSWLKPDDVDRIHQARAILLQQLSNPPCLTQLARQVGLNECSLKRGFRQVFGTTAFGYLHHYRLEQARQMLATDDMTVGQVAQSIGFARNYFTKAFCQKFGCTPGAYRKGQRSLPSA
jgi:AraC-like DNA-binding protein